jgi:hypothetical protein
VEPRFWRQYFLTLTLAGISAGCSDRAQIGEADPVERGVVEQRLEDYYRDFSARDWGAFADHFWPGADITTVWQLPGEDTAGVVVTTIEEFVQQAPQGPGSREVFEEWMIGADIRLYKNLAQAWVRYGARFGDPGNIDEWEGIDAITLLKHGGTWKIVTLVFTGDDSEGE